MRKRSFSLATSISVNLSNEQSQAGKDVRMAYDVSVYKRYFLILNFEVSILELCKKNICYKKNSTITTLLPLINMHT